jgi:hypothetical protein
MRIRLLAPILFFPLAAFPALGQNAPPIIDTHLHPERLADFEERAGTVPLPICVPMLSYLPPLDPNQAWDQWHPIAPPGRTLPGADLVGRNGGRAPGGDDRRSRAPQHHRSPEWFA